MEQNLDVADPWLSRCHDECPVPCCDMSQISVMTAGSWTTCYIFCYITISYTQQHNISEARLIMIPKSDWDMEKHCHWLNTVKTSKWRKIKGCKRAKMLSGKGPSLQPLTQHFCASHREGRDTGDESSKYQNFITYSKLLLSATKTCVLSVRSLSIQLLLPPDSCGRKLYLLGTGF